MSRISIPIASQAWTWRMANSNGNAKAESLSALQDWTPVTAFPSVIHMELLANKLIPDYNIGENERQMQWAGEVDWEYQAVFPTTADEAAKRDSLDIVFDGLDTFATVYLNDVEILKSTNMFIPARVPVKAALKSHPGEENRLRIVFESAAKVGQAFNDKYGARWSRMRDNRRNYTRKAQYHWGWDWGPIVLTAGPYLPVYLEAYDMRIDNFHIRTSLAADHSVADISVDVKTSLGRSSTATIDIRVADAAGAELFAGSTPVSEAGEASLRVSVKSPKLWWSHGLGQQHLYTAHVSLLGSESRPLDESSARFGIRTIELIQRPLDNKPGKTFMFRINGRDIFAQGVNWIPADNLLPTISRKRYFDWIRTVAFGNMNMIRVWGGGIYETDDFFDACDEMGILVWHDYAFACGDYPLHDEFIESVAREAEVQTIRIRNRASLALLAGGNEDFMMYDWLKRGPDYDHHDLVGPFEDQPFPQRKIFLNTLSAAAARLCPDTAYWPNSPWGGDQVNDLTIGDIHQWEVWHISQLPYQEYKAIGGRFVSEFGMQAFPVWRTVSYFLRGTPEREHHPLSRVVDCHNKGRGSTARLLRYLSENVRFDVGASSLARFAYATQLVQAEAYAGALRGWKRQFGGPGDEACAGALIWQLNDVYPGTSWALVDYFGRPKPAFYAVRRACAPLSVGVERHPGMRCVDENAPRTSYVPSFELFAYNIMAADVPCTLVLRAYDMATGAWLDLPPNDASRAVTLRAGYNSELGVLTSQVSWAEDTLVVLEATLVDTNSRRVLARSVDWPEPFRYLYWPDDTRLSIHVEKIAALEGKDNEKDSWEDRVTVVANQPLKGVWLEPIYDGDEKDDEPEPVWEDNMVDLMPGDELSFRVKGLRGRKVGARFLADWDVGSGKTQQH